MRVRSAARSILWIVPLVGLLSCGKPTVTVEWKPDGNGFVQFSTNDSKYYGMGFFDPLSNETLDPSTTASATVVKKSGAGGAPFGMIFANTGTAFHLVALSMDGKYLVGTYSAGTWYVIIPWTPEAIIQTGANAQNTLAVTNNGAGTYSISINGQNVPSGITVSALSGPCGFYVEIGGGSDEHFPSSEVDVRFKMLAPVAYP